MLEKDLEERAYSLLQKFKRITPALLVRKLKITMQMANKICHIVWLRMHKEARALVAELDYSWSPQMDNVRSKNLLKFKGKRKSC